MPTLRYPQDLLKFLYWVFFKPITLDQYIRDIDPKLDKNPDLLALWRRRAERPAVLPVVLLSLFHLVVLPWLAAFPLAGLFALAGFEVNWSFVTQGVWLGTVFGVLAGTMLDLSLGMVEGVALGVATGVGLGVALGVGLGVAESVEPGAVGMLLLVASGVALGVGLGVAAGVGLGVAGGVARGVAVSVMWGVMVGSIAESVAAGVVGGVVVSVAFMPGYFRLFLYLCEAPWVWFLARAPGRGRSPLHYDEVIWLPLLGLDQYLINLARQERAIGLQEIAFTAASLNQSWAARRAVETLFIDDVENAKSLKAIAGISSALRWLPPETRDDMKSPLLGLDEIAAHARAAVESETPYNRQEQLRLGLNLLEKAQQGLAADPRWGPGKRLISALGVWQGVFSSEYKLALDEKGIPNVYVAGSPLAEQSQVFKGRRAIFRVLERELVSAAEQRPALLLFGARRMGKTSALRQLPSALGPQAIPVTVDLQSLALSATALSLLAKMVEEIQNSALKHRGIKLPEISTRSLQDDPYRAFSDWMEKVGAAVGERWILLCLDEYEYLQKLLQDGRVDERAFQLLRVLIQNHPRLTLLFSGAHTLDDLPPMWSNYLINARVVKIEPLAREDAETLIVKPIPDFPLIYDEGALGHLLSETNGHPYLIQSVCQGLVHRLNDEERFTANRDDVERALNAALESGTGYFNDLWENDSDEAQRAVLLAIAKSKEGALSLSRLPGALKTKFDEHEIRRAAQRLTHRDVLQQAGDDVRFRFPLVRRWVRKKKLLLEDRV